MNKRYPLAKKDVGGKMKTIGEYRNGHPEGAIVHFTAGGPNAEGTVKGGIADGYCFFVIAPDGTVYQNFDLDRWGYHAGKSSHQKLGNSVSRFLVGIEICNAGKVRQLDGKTYRPWFNDPDHYRKHNEPIPPGVPNPAKDLKEGDVRHVDRRHNREAGWYHRYSEAQEKALAELLLWLKDNSPDVFDLNLVLGHDEVSPGRKNDPGGALSVTMPGFRESLIARHQGNAPAAPSIPTTPASPATASPRIAFSPDTFLSDCLVLQKAVNRYPGIDLVEDGYAGEKTSDAFRLLTGYFLSGDPRTGRKPKTPKEAAEPPPKPNTARRLKIARKILEWEARRDSKGRIAIYEMPGNDGGGKFEVAGINVRYHPQMANRLASLIRAGKHPQAEDEAVEYLATYTDGVARYVSNAGVEAFLRDTSFNRGPGGAAKVLQIALKVTVDGGVGPETRKAIGKIESSRPVELLQSLRDAREHYERHYIGYRSNFWPGLVNRWNKAHAFALDLLRSADAKVAASEVKLSLSDESTGLIAHELDEKPVSEPLDTSRPVFHYDPETYSVVCERFQELANQISSAGLEEDGLAGTKTAASFELLFGHRLSGLPANS